MLFENSSSDISFYPPFISSFKHLRKILWLLNILNFYFGLSCIFSLFFFWSVYIFISLSFLYLWHWFCFKSLGFTYIISNPVAKCVKVLYRISRYHYQRSCTNINTCSCAKYLNGSDFLYCNSDKQYFSFLFFFLLDFDVQSS
jgi:hypothetical protein